MEANWPPTRTDPVAPGMNFPITSEEGIDSDWLGVPMYFGGIGQEATLAALTHAGLAIERAEPIEEDEDGS